MANNIAERIFDLMVDSDPTGENRRKLYVEVKEWRSKYPGSYRRAVPVLRDILDAILEGPGETATEPEKCPVEGCDRPFDNWGDHHGN